MGWQGVIPWLSLLLVGSDRSLWKSNFGVSISDILRQPELISSRWDGRIQLMLLAQGRERAGGGFGEDSMGSGGVWDGLVGGGVMEVECSGMVEWWSDGHKARVQLPKCPQLPGEE